MAVSWRTSAFQKKRPWNPYFCSVFLGARFLGQGVKEILKSHPKKKEKNWLITEKLFFGVFAVFLLGASFFLIFVFLFGFFCFFFFCLVFFVGGFKGQVRWPKGPPHLALNPPYFFFFSYLFFVLFFFVFFGGFKGQVRWPKGPPHLVLNPPYLFWLFFCFVFFFGFVFWLLNTGKKPCFPPEKGIFCLFSMFFFLSPLAILGLPLFLFLFLCLSFFFFSFFLPSCLCFCFLLVPCFCLFLSFSFFFAFFHERHNIKILNCKFFFFFWNHFFF